MKGIVIMGMPCSGKTTSCKYLQEEKNIPYYSTGDMVRDMAAEEIGEDYDSSELGEFSTIKRQEDEVYATREALKRARERDIETVVLEGIRCKEEIDFLRNELDEVLTVFISVPFEERVRRLVDRGREGEASEEDMKERDEREKGWGLEEIIEDEYYDIEVDGNCSAEKLYEKIDSIVTDFVKE